MSTFGSTTEDVDGVPKNIDRGPPEEMRMTEAELRGAMQSVHKAKLTMGEIATVKALMHEMELLRAMIDDVCEQNSRLIGLYATIRGELDEFKKQWNIERSSWLAKRGGSTTPEDN
jgi:hypothetical protein